MTVPCGPNSPFFARHVVSDSELEFQWPLVQDRVKQLLLYMYIVGVYYI